MVGGVWWVVRGEWWVVGGEWWVVSGGWINHQFTNTYKWLNTNAYH